MISKDPGILRFLFGFGLISQDDLRPDFGLAAQLNKNDMIPSPDSDLEHEILRGYDVKSERERKI